MARWLDRAAQTCRRFNRRTITGFAVEELQADEIRSFAGSKKRPTWIFVAIEVWSRLWPSTMTGRRSYRNTLALLRDVANRMDFQGLPLIVTDGFDFYEKVVRRVFGPAALYGHVLKTRRNDRVVKVERRAVHGAGWRFEEALNSSGDSSTLKTSFIERLNLTIRQSSAYLLRRTLSHARSEEKLEEHLELLRCYYNFARPHGALKFTQDTDSGDAGWARRQATDAQGHLRVHAAILINSDRRDEGHRAEQAAHGPVPGYASGCLNNSSWRKHRFIRTAHRVVCYLVEHGCSFPDPHKRKYSHLLLFGLSIIRRLQQAAADPAEEMTNIGIPLIVSRMPPAPRYP